MSARSLVSRLVFAVGVLMVCWCAPALAGVTHPFLSSFGSFSNVQGVAVDQDNGDVYVLDTGAGGGSLFKFDAAGNPLKFTGLPGEPLAVTGLHGGAETENEVAVDSSAGPAKGDIYVAVSSSNGEKIDVIAPDGKSLGTLSESRAPWGETCGVAVDPAGNVYVGIFEGYIDKFAPVSNPVTNDDYVSSIVGAVEPCNVAVDGHGNVFVANYGVGTIERYEASEFGSLSATSSIVASVGSTLAVNPADDHVYVNAGGLVSEFGSSGEPFQESLSTFGQSGESFGVAVNEASGNIYVPDGSGHISVYGPGELTPDASVQATSDMTGESATLNGTVNPEGLPVSSCQFEYGTSAGSFPNTVACSSNPGSGSSPVGVSAAISGLTPATVYHYKLTVTTASGTGESSEGSFTTPAPPKIVSESFTNVGSASATVSAKIEPGGRPTTFRVEYGSTTAYGLSTVVARVGEGTEAVNVLAYLDGLQPGTLYHLRVVATSEVTATLGEDLTFSTLSTGLLDLPDGRSYEMVTPPDNEDVQVYRPQGSGKAGGEVIFTSDPTRAAADGHAVAYVGDPDAAGNGSQGSGEGNEYMATRGPDGDWTQTTIQPTGLRSPVFAWFAQDLSISVLTSQEPLVAGMPVNYSYIYARYDSDGSLHPLFTLEPSSRKSAATFGAANVNGYVGEESLGLYFAGASANGKSLFFEANDALAYGAIDGGQHENNLYESTEGILRLVNVLPNSSSEPNASFGAPPVESEESENASHAISADGSRVFWTDINSGALYVRENGSSTYLVGEHATFLTASADGSRVVYIKDGDLYEDALPDNVSRDIAPGGRVLGLAGASEDARYIYFVAEADLAAGATAGQPNLYLYHAGATQIVAKLGSEATEDEQGVYGNGNFDDWRTAVGHRTAQAAPDGHALVFASKQSLTGYDNQNQEGRAVSEVYVYDASSRKLSCASCIPSGERPVTALGLPAGYLVTTGHQAYQARSIAADGSRVFFESIEPLVPQDVNGKTDLYEWERDGAGSCTDSTGCVYILSNGAGEGGSYFLDASEDGSDVFFLTEAQLLPQDRNEVYDLYDARVGATQPAAQPQCTGSGCQGIPAAPPIFATPSSVTFDGVGNLAKPVKMTVNTKPKRKKKTRRKRKANERHRSRGHRGHVAKRARKQGAVYMSGRGQQ